MARTALTSVAPTAAGTTFTPVAGNVDGNAIADKVIVVAANSEKLYGPFSSVYNQITGADVGKVYLDLSAVANATVALVSRA